MKHLLKALPVLLMLSMTTGCAHTSGEELGLTMDGKLTPCPASPNCVSSDVKDGNHAIAPLEIISSAEQTWTALLTYIETQPRWTLKVSEPSYLRVEARTRLLRFVDDVEFKLRPADKRIAMRSASRVGYSDLGTNRRRLEGVREALADQNLVRGNN
ncbi:MAG: DUF1499 domain-containing protein [Woeseia sp.]